MTSAIPASRHFSLQELHSGVFAAIATDEGWAVSNAGIVDLGDHMLVFDAFSNHLAAADLNKSAVALTGRTVDFVVIGHGHRDHYKGTQAFDCATIVSTRKTCESLARLWKERTETVRKEGLESIKSGIKKEFEAWESNPATSGVDKVLWESYEQSLLQGIETYSLRLPSVGFETSMSFHGSKRTAEAITYGGGHSVSDAFLFLPEERIAYLGDLLFIGYQPFIGDGNPEELLTILDKVEDLDPKWLVPGHGPVGTIGEMQKTRDYVMSLMRIAENVKASKMSTEQALEIPKPFDALRWRAFWKENLDFLTKRESQPAQL